jgi:protein-disulfide isomerase
MHGHGFQLTEPVGAADHVLGSPDAPVTVVEYGDFECPRCKQASGAVRLLFARFESQIRFVFRHFPLEEIHPHALVAAEVAECAGTQGKFWQMHDLLFENQQYLGLAQLYDYAQALELDLPRFTVEVDEERHLQRVRRDQRSGESSGVRSTPTFFVNGRIQDVSYELLSLFDAVADELRALTTERPRQTPPDPCSAAPRE